MKLLDGYFTYLVIAGLANEEADTTYPDTPVRFKFDFLAPSLGPVSGATGVCAPTINPTRTYDDAIKKGIQYDIIWVPAGKIHRFLHCV